MQRELTCEQVGAIITFYLEGRLSTPLQKAVKHHLAICPECNAKFEELKRMVDRFKKNNCTNTLNDNTQENFKQKQYAEFKSNLSAYIDNELDDKENIRIKKITISNPIARKDLEDMYAFKRLLHNSFEKTKSDVRYDFSKNILTQMNIPAKDSNSGFKKLVILFFIMFLTIIAGAVHLWYLNF